MRSLVFWSIKRLPFTDQNDTPSAPIFLAFLNLGLSPWSLICYTDALGLIFPILTLYVFIRPAKHKWLSYALSAIIGTIGYFLKPQCFICLLLFSSLSLYAFKDKSQIKPLLFSFLCIVVTFVAMKGGINALCARKNIVLNQEQSYSAAHFFMMGLNEETKGVFSADDMHYFLEHLLPKQNELKPIYKQPHPVSKIWGLSD